MAEEKQKYTPRERRLFELVVIEITFFLLTMLFRQGDSEGTFGVIELSCHQLHTVEASQKLSCVIRRLVDWLFDVQSLWREKASTLLHSINF